MTSVVRIKRRLSQEPVEALLLASSNKRFKGDSLQNQNVFKFCGTISHEDEGVEHISRIVENRKIKSHRSQKSTTNRRDKSKSSASFPEKKKYKVLSTFRGLNESESEQANLKVYDLVCEEEIETEKTPDTVMCNGVPLVVESCTPNQENLFVYDYYYSDVGKIDDSYIDQLMSVQPYEFSYESDESEEDSEDSNAEDCYRNDYPDTEEDSDVENLIDATGCINLRDDDSVELSTEDEDNIYSNDYDDGSYHSTAYSAYKKRAMKTLFNDTNEDSNDSNDSEDDEPLEDFD